MNPFATAMRNLVALFVDDGWLAAATLAVVAITGAVRFMLPIYPLLAGAILVIGCLGALIRSVLSGMQR